MSYSIERYELHNDDEVDYLNIITDGVKYLDKLATSNIALLHLIIYNLMDNFKITTKHICFKLLNDSNEVKKLEITNEEHTCSCSFFQNLLRIWDKHFDEKFKFDKILFTLIKSYKFKFIFAFSYITLYDIIVINDVSSIKYFSVQIITVEDIAEVIVLSEDFVNNLFEKLLFLTKNYLKDEINTPNLIQQKKAAKNFDTFFMITFGFFNDIAYISKPKPAKIMSKYVKIFKILIDILEIIQNKIKFKVAKYFQYEGFYDSFVSIELYLLNLFSLLTTNFDFSVRENSQEILFYLIDKIRLNNNLDCDGLKLNQLKQSINLIRVNDIDSNLNKTKNGEIYRFHIPLSRALAIFLNRFSIYESHFLKIDFFMAIKNILFSYYSSKCNNDLYNSNTNSTNLDKGNKLNYEFEDLLLEIVYETIKFFGFLNSIKCKNWVYYGENMLYYEILYFHYQLFYLCDFTLIKLILSQDHNCRLLNISTLLKLSDVNNSYNDLLNNLFNEEKYLEHGGKFLFSKNLEFFLKIMRNNSYIIDLLGYSYDKLRCCKLNDYLLENIITNSCTSSSSTIFTSVTSFEKENFIEFVKIYLIHIILSKGNSVYFSEIEKLLPFYIKEILGSNGVIEKLIGDLCEKTVNKNKTVLFKLKNEYLKKVDLFLIIDPKNYNIAEKYLMDFKRGEVPLLNTPDLSMNTLNFLKITNANFANHFFQSGVNLEKSVKLLINFLKISSSSGNTVTVHFPIFLVFLKIIDIFSYSSKNNGYLTKFENLLLNPELLENLKNFKTADKNLEVCCKYLFEKISILSPGEDLKIETSLENEEEVRKQKLKEMKAKTALLFKNKSNLFKKKLDTSESEKVNSGSSNSININSSMSLMLHETEPEWQKNKIFDCIICHQKINSQEFFSKPFGRVAVLTSDSFIYHSKLQTIKKEYEKIIFNSNNGTYGTCEEIQSENYSLNNDQQIFVKELMLTYKRTKPEIKKSLRYVTCNHYVHFSCCDDLILKNYHSDAKQIIFICPLCKTISNCIVPYFDYSNLITDEENFNIIKTLTLAQVFGFYKTDTQSDGLENEFNFNDMFTFKHPNFVTNHDSTLKNKMSNDISFLDSITSYVESIISLQGKITFLITDFSKFNEQFKFYEIIKNFFLNSLNLFDILREEYIKSLTVIKDYVLSLKLLIKHNKLDPKIFFNRFLNILFYWKSNISHEDNIVYNIDTDKISQIYFELIFLILVIFDDTEVNYFNIIFKQFLPLIFIQYYSLQIYCTNGLKINPNIMLNTDPCPSTKSYPQSNTNPNTNGEDFLKFENFLNIFSMLKNSSSIKNFLNFYLRKTVILKNIFKEDKKVKCNFSNVHEEFNFYLNELGISIVNKQGIEYFEIDEFLNNENDMNLYPSFWTPRENFLDITKIIFKRYVNTKLNTFKSLKIKGIFPNNNLEVNLDIINPSLLLITNNIKFNFINIPKTLIDLHLKYFKVICEHCEKNPNYSILCLVCGEKLCYTETCCKDYGKKKNIYEYVWHNKICGLGNGAYLHLYNGKITFSLLGNFINMDNGIYVDKYGESLKSQSISNNFVLNEDLFNNILNEFKTLEYRNYFRSRHLNNNFLDEQE